MEAYKLLPLGSEWQLKKSGQNEPVGRYADKQQAFREAITLANRRGAKLVLEPPPRLRLRVQPAAKSARRR